MADHSTGMHTTRAPTRREPNHHREQSRLNNLNPIKRRRTRHTPQHIPQRPIDMRLKRPRTRIYPLSKHRRAIQQLPRHPNPLRTLPRKHKHNTPTTTTKPPTPNIPRRATLSQRTQTIQQLLTPTNNNSTILKHRPRKQRKPNIPHIQPRISTQKLKQTPRLPHQRTLTPPREHQRHNTTQHPHTTNNPIRPVRPINPIRTINTINPIDPDRITNHHTTRTTIQNRCFLQNHMRVSTTSPKRRNTSTTRLTTTPPHNLLSQKRHSTSRPIDLPRRTIDMQRTRQHTTTQSHHHLDHTSHTSSSLRMTNIRLQRPQPQRIITTTQPTIRSQQRLRLNRIAQHRPSPMTLNHIHPSPRHPSIQQRLTNHPLLRRTIRRRQTITRTILIHRTTTNNSQHPMTQTQRIRQTLQQQHTNPLTPAGAIGRIRIGLTPPIRSQGALARDPQEQRGRPHNRDTPHQSQRTITFSKRLRGAMKCHKRGGASRIHSYRRSLKSKFVGNASRYDAAAGARPHARLTPG